MKKSLLFIICLFEICITYAQTNPFAGGTGSSTDPYQISTAVQLDSVRNYPNSSFVLINDIDMNVSPYNENEGWDAIGTTGNPFTGIFDGAGYEIKNLFIDREASQIGLFGKDSTATLSNIGVINCNITGNNAVGGLSGTSYKSSITKCYTSGTISGTKFCGGLSGSSSYITMKYCYSYANVSAPSGMYTGGLAGLSNYSSFSYSYASGNVTGHEDVGGLIGRLQNSPASISYCYTTGEVFGYLDVAGIAGRTGGNFKILDCYSISSVSGTTNVGSIVGSNTTTITDCYYNKLLMQTKNNDGTSKTTIEMISEDTYDWDFINTWTIREDSTYPGLQNINNAPFAIRDTIHLGSNSGSIASFINNDFDIETLQNSLVYKIVSIPEGATLSGTDYTFASNAADVELDTLIYRIGELKAEGDTLWGNYAYIIVINGNNSAPYFTSNPVTSVTVGEKYTLLLKAGDLENDDITFSLVDGPSDMFIRNDSLIWITDNTVDGTNKVTVVASDNSLTDTLSFSLKANYCPVITSLPDTIAYLQDGNYQYPISASDKNGDKLTYSLKTKPTGMAIKNDTIVYWTLTADTYTSGTVIVNVTDGSLTTSQSFVIYVADNNNNFKPEITSTAPTAATEGIKYTYQVIARDFNTDNLTYSLTNAPSGMTISDSVITWTPESGTTTSGEITLTVSDGSLSDIETFTITVENAPIITSTAPTTATVGVKYTYTITATDANADDLTYSLSNAPDGMSISEGVITWTPESGTTTSGEITLTVSDGSLSDTETFTISVTTTGIEDGELETITIYPNPTKERIYLRGFDCTALVLIYNSQGQLVLEQEVTEGFYISISNLPKGTYLSKILLQEQVITKTIIKAE